MPKINIGDTRVASCIAKACNHIEKVAKADASIQTLYKEQPQECIKVLKERLTIPEDEEGTCAQCVYAKCPYIQMVADRLDPEDMVEVASIEPEVVEENMPSDGEDVGDSEEETPQDAIDTPEASPEESELGDQKDEEMPFSFSKSKEAEQLVFGWANWAKDEDGNDPFDWDGDVKSPEVLEKAAYDYVLNYRTTGEMHQGTAKGHLVESIMFTKEKMQALGIPEGILPEGWWVGFYIPDPEVFAKVVDGTYKMFSIQGSSMGKRVRKV